MNFEYLKDGIKWGWKEELMYGREHGNRHVTARSDHEQPRRAMGVATNSRLDCTSKLFFYFYTNSFLFFLAALLSLPDIKRF
jgi:guanyl-specific ribonuclease Sa